MEYFIVCCVYLKLIIERILCLAQYYRMICPISAGNVNQIQITGAHKKELVVCF